MPAKLRIGYYNGSLDYGTVPSQVTLTGPRGLGASFRPDTPTNRDRNDYYFFDVAGLSAGDQLTLSIQPNDNNDPGIRNRNPSLGGLTFDAHPAPEPATIAALGVGALALIRRKGK